MIPIILALVLATQTANPKGEEILNQMANLYSGADGIILVMKSQIYSKVFEETTSTTIAFNFNPPDTFYYSSDYEQVLGIADTTWVLSKKHKQIQKKLTESYLKPTDFIINWNNHYVLKNYQKGGDFDKFDLVGKEGVSPSQVRITLNQERHLRYIYYKDASGDDVNIRISQERLARTAKIHLINIDIPKGYQLIDLTE